jgi:hypothetical protein
MRAQIKYRDIQKSERRRLTAEILRQPRFRLLMFAFILIAVLLSGTITDYIVAKNGPFLERFSVKVVTALILFAVIWELPGRRPIKQEVERLKNAESSDRADVSV